jgi:hypothetical protein
LVALGAGDGVVFATAVGLLVDAAAVSATLVGFEAGAGALLLSAAALGAGAALLPADLGAAAALVSTAGCADEDPLAGADGALVTFGAAPAASAALVAAPAAGVPEPALWSVPVTLLMLDLSLLQFWSIDAHSVTAGGFAQPRPLNRCFLGTT